MKFTSNMGKTDRTLRLMVAFVIGVLYYLDKIDGPMGNTLLLLAIVFALTAFVRFCPLYVPFKMDTREDKSDN
ncbi:MAG: hypothetical protein RLZZ252_360 [Bacteroidota bacterium]